MMRVARSLLLALLSLASRVPGQMYGPVEIHTIPIDKTVAELATKDSFSSPEMAYATIHRRLASGDLDWRDVSVARIRGKLPPPPDKPRSISQRAADGWLQTRIVEVRMVSDNVAFVIGQWPVSKSFDVRCFELESGRWLSLRNDQADTLEHARRVIDNAAANRRSGETWKKRVTYPADYIKTFDAFLASRAQDPKQLLLKSLADHRLVAVGELHHRPTYWQLNTDVVGDAAFRQGVGTIYLELPMNDQPLIDRFLANDQLDPQPVIDTLRDMLWMGWPDQAMLEFFEAVWTANHDQPAERRIRIVLIDMARPWAQIRKREDWKAYEVDRDQLMADNIINDLAAQARDSRHALLIAGYMHVAKNLRLRDGGPLKTAGWRLSQKLGPEFFALVQHSPQISNIGRVYGRAARGLFDSAFRNAGYRPVAFRLSESPFGGEPFDIAADVDCAGTFQEAFDGYIFLEKLEDEWFAPLISGFYTDDFCKELDRRLQMMEGRTLDQLLGVERAGAESFQRWMGRDWGSPRSWRDELGTIDAWRLGDDAPAMDN